MKSLFSQLLLFWMMRGFSLAFTPSSITTTQKVKKPSMNIRRPHNETIELKITMKDRLVDANTISRATAVLVGTMVIATAGFTFDIPPVTAITSEGDNSMMSAIVATTKGNINRGKTIFQNNCASCHPGGGNAIAKKRTLNKDAIEEYIGLDEEAINSFIQDNMVHRGALAFSHKMSDQEYQDVSAFVYDSSIGDKW